jgi:sulfur relay (sulfurtransferase) complex TusBCD TusD component (DsrE family)
LPAKEYFLHQSILQHTEAYNPLSNFFEHPVKKAEQQFRQHVRVSTCTSTTGLLHRCAIRNDRMEQYRGQQANGTASEGVTIEGVEVLSEHYTYFTLI